MVDIEHEVMAFKEEINSCSEFELKALLEGLTLKKNQYINELQRISMTRELRGEARTHAQLSAMHDRDLAKKKIAAVQTLIGKRRKIRKGISPPGFEYLKNFHRAAELILPAPQLKTVRAKAREIKQQEDRT